MPPRADRQAAAPDSGFAFPPADASDAPALVEQLIAGAAPSRERARTFRVVGAARLVMGGVLLAWFAATALTQHGGSLGVGLTVAASYVVLVFAQLIVSLSMSRAFAWQVLGAVLSDLVVYGALQFLAGEPAREFVLSYTLPVLAAAVFGSLRFTLATAAAVTLILLGQAVTTLERPGDLASPQVFGAGFVGAAYFAMGVLAWQLAQRVAREERRARSSEVRASRQLAINRHVLLEQPYGVLVLDAQLRIEAANPSATRLLGLLDWDPSRPAEAARFAGARELAAAARQHAASRAPLVFTGAEGLRLQARVQALRTLPGGPGYVVFVQDLRDISQQLQQDKLAALGRLVAGVAHEIRNPLAAIAQANQLSSEPGLSDAQRARMAELIAQNVERLDRIVEDVLDIGRAGNREGVELQPMRMLRELAAEFAGPNPARIELRADDEAAVLVFDPLHLRRVLVNLLSNARRFASERDGAIRVRLRGSQRVREIGVANDGPVVDADKRAQLFEPFFTTDSRGTGLGLYISQELCSRYGARLEYRVREAGGVARGEFVIGVGPGAAEA